MWPYRDVATKTKGDVATQTKGIVMQRQVVQNVLIECRDRVYSRAFVNQEIEIAK